MFHGEPRNLANGGVPPGIKPRELTNDEREVIVCGLLEELEDGWLKFGTISQTAKNYGVVCQTISMLWNKSVKVQESGNYSLSVVHNKKVGMTNNLKYDLQALSDELKQLLHNWCQIFEMWHILSKSQREQFPKPCLLAF